MCPTFNIMLANKYSWRTDSQACDPPKKPGVYEYGMCDTDHFRDKLCTVDQYDLYPAVYGFGNTSVWGPEGLGGIDTQCPFHVKIDFNTDEEGKLFTNYVVTLTQGPEDKIVMKSSNRK